MPRSYAQSSVYWYASRANWKSPGGMLAIWSLLCFIATIPYAFAGKEFPPEGTNSGAPFREVCPPGQYMIGAHYRSGNWMDQISITCAPVDATGMTGPQWLGPPIGGNGGSPNSQSCPPDFIITGGGILRNSGNHYVQMMDLACESTITKSTYPLSNVGTPSTVFPEVYQNCPPGEAVIGIHGRAGLYVDAIGLICGAFSKITCQLGQLEPGPEACRGLKADQVPEEWVGMLRAHNDRRKQHCAAPLIWSSELAAEAQAYADKCILDTHGSEGENMADHWAEVNGNPVLPASSDKDAFENTWYCEVNNYDFNNPQSKSGFTANCKDVNAHFTQVVWKDTCQLGCGRATCDITDEKGVVHKGTHWVCRYKPEGNKNANDVNVLKQQVGPPTCQ
jgi:hypothetical protein